MPKVTFVQKAQKDYPDHGIAKGESYYRWSLRMGRGSLLRMSKTRPRPSQLTTSEYYGTVYAAQEEVEDALAAFADPKGIEDLVATLRSAAETIEEAGQDCSEKRDSMEASFSGGCPTMDLLEERSVLCESTAQEVNQAADDIEALDLDEYKNNEEDLVQEVQSIVDGIGWDL